MILLLLLQLLLLLLFLTSCKIEDFGAKHEFAIVGLEREIPKAAFRAKVAIAIRMMTHVMTAVNGVKEEMHKVVCHHLLNARRRRAAPTGNSVGDAATHDKEDRTLQCKIAEIRVHRLRAVVIRVQWEHQSRQPRHVAQRANVVITSVIQIEKEVLHDVEWQPRRDWQHRVVRQQQPTRD